MKWYKRGSILLVVLAVLTGIMAALTRPQVVPADTEMKRWHLAADGLQYLDESGEPVRNGWQEAYGTEYYFDHRGVLAAGGWQKVLGDWYYLDETGRKNIGWFDYEDQRYYLDSDGKMLTGWIKTDGNTYYMSGTGEMQAGWIDLDDGRYLLSEEGVMQTGWVDTEEGRRFLDANGRMHIGWVDTEEGRSFLNAEGVMQTGWIDTDEGRYYLDGDGLMQSSGWIDVEDGRYYLAEDGRMHTGWLEKDGETYYLNKGGNMATGFTEVDDGHYYFDSSGIRQTGWVNLDSVKYYFGEDGKRHTGWLDGEGGEYYLDKNGIMRTGWVTMEGKSYFFDKDGVYDPDAPLKSTVLKTGPMVALTFDDGPGKHTDRLLNCLEENQVRATFFMVGPNVERYPDTLKRMTSLDCEIGNHTQNHKKLTSLEEAEIRSEINETNQRLVNILGSGGTVLRPPYGAYDDKVKMNSAFPLILWSIDTLDWKTLNAQATVDSILDSVQDGDIILMHDIHSTSVDAAEIVIPELLKRGYQLVTVSELAAANGRTLEAGSSYGSIRP